MTVQQPHVITLKLCLYQSLDLPKLGQSKVMNLLQRGIEQNSQRLEGLVVKHHGRGSPSGFRQ